MRYGAKLDSEIADCNDRFLDRIWDSVRPG